METQAGGDVSGWVQVGSVIAAVAAGAWAVVKGRLGEASTAITQTRAEATEVFVKETQQNREALMALREILTSERDLLVALKDAVVRLLAIQENIATMMREQRESEKEMERQANLLRLIAEKDAEKERGERDRERDRDRDWDRRRGHE